jgi:UDPglucose 6-dehydrogenase
MGMKLSVLGASYVGTVTAACLAELGHDVVCADVKEAWVERLAAGDPPFFETGLPEMIKSNLGANRLEFTTDMHRAVAHGDVIFLCISTVPTKSSKPDLRPLQDIVKLLTQSIDRHKTIVEKTTLPVKTGAWLQSELSSTLPSHVTFDVAVVPHFMREGTAIQDFMHPDRIVIGSEAPTATEVLVQLYSPLSAPLLITDMHSAEIIKHASNAFLAMKISFINTIAQLCEETGADITKVATGIGMDKRISPAFLSAGIGYGGVFFSKDIASLMMLADEYHINLDLLKATEVINRYQRLHFVERLESAVLGLEQRTIAVWGLAYRPMTDDMREAPSLQIIRSLQNRGAKLRAYDPIAMPNARTVLGRDVYFAESPYDAATGADAIVILTEWDCFKTIDFATLKQASACRVIVDGRNLYNPSHLFQQGFLYVSVGRDDVDGRLAKLPISQTSGAD